MTHANARASANILQRMSTILTVEILLMQLRGPIICRGLPCTRLHVGGADGPNDGSKSPRHVWLRYPGWVSLFQAS